MPASGTIQPPDDQNPGVDRELLAQAAELRRKAEKFGLAEEPGYSLAPALGGNLIRQTRGAGGRRSPFSPVLGRAG